MNKHKIYIPAENWIAQTICDYCQANNIGNASISGIGSIKNVWILVNPDGHIRIKNFSDSPSYEMTSILGNSTLRQGMAVYDKTKLPSGKYPEFDNTVDTLNPYVHVHVTFANPDMTISGGHLLDAQVSIGAEIILDVIADNQCVPGISQGNVPVGCIINEPVSVYPFGTFYNWDKRFWFPPQ